MQCDICRKINGYIKGCPNYSAPKAKRYCSVCEQGIYDGEEYIENNDGEFRHFDCFNGMRDLLEWLGYEIKTMEEIYETVYEENE